MIAMALAALLSQPTVTSAPIEVPYQIMPAWVTYRRCVEGQFRQAMLSVHNLGEARNAWSASVQSCRDVRAEQLARALTLQTDHRVYGGRESALQIVRQAFDRFDTEFHMEWNDPSAGAEGTKESNAQN